MILALKHLRDFLTPEALKFLPGNLMSEPVIILKQQIVEDNAGVRTHRTALQVFDRSGNWIGEISNPDWIPSDKWSC